ncbi:MAG: type II toxin-antitoxin system RelE/ParE family toxin [Chlorobium sp.]|nr:MAG: type II toxin-antitoxin system RelE/ParE family toxin [Chlorobium sp.]
MKIFILSVAEKELTDAVDYYNDQCPGLGYEFAAEVKHTFDRIALFPEAWQIFSKRARRCLLDRFPYGVLYRIDNDTIRVGALMHLRRDPKHWHQRIGQL